MCSFNPNAIGIPNGNFFALPFTPDESAVVLIPVPWDVTTSYQAGSAAGPDAIIEASAQIDLFDLNNGNFWEQGIGTIEANAEIASLNEQTRPLAEAVIAQLEEGVPEDSHTLLPLLAQVNQASTSVNNWVYQTSLAALHQGKVVGVVGGDHSSPTGLIQAIADTHTEFGILHIDAHADLRQAYEGFEYSHASIMYNAIMRHSNIKALAQVGIRDLCTDEWELINATPNISLFDNYTLTDQLMEGATWAQLCDTIIDVLPAKVYISFDIDGLSPDLCPNTGTPVPGGLSFEQANYLMKQLVRKGKQIVGFDLCEVAPSDTTEWDANVGARILYKLCGYAINSQKNL